MKLLGENIEKQNQNKILGDDFVTEVIENDSFKHYSQQFKDLTKQKQVLTLDPIVSVMISYNSKYAISLTK